MESWQKSPRTSSGKLEENAISCNFFMSISNRSETLATIDPKMLHAIADQRYHRQLRAQTLHGQIDDLGPNVILAELSPAMWKIVRAARMKLLLTGLKHSDIFPQFTPEDIMQAIFRSFGDEQVVAAEVIHDERDGHILPIGTKYGPIQIVASAAKGVYWRIQRDTPLALGLPGLTTIGDTSDPEFEITPGVMISDQELELYSQRVLDADPLAAIKGIRTILSYGCRPKLSPPSPNSSHGIDLIAYSRGTPDGPEVMGGICLGYNPESGLRLVTAYNLKQPGLLKEIHRLQPT